MPHTNNTEQNGNEYNIFVVESFERPTPKYKTTMATPRIIYTVPHKWL